MIKTLIPKMSNFIPSLNKISVIKMQNVTSGNLTRPKTLDDFKYIEEPEMTQLFLDELAKLRFHGVSVSTYHIKQHLRFDLTKRTSWQINITEEKTLYFKGPVSFENGDRRPIAEVGQVIG